MANKGSDTKAASPTAAQDAILSHGSVTIHIPAHLTPDERAGKMSPDEVKHTPKPPLGIGLACDQTADAIDKAGDKFMVPAGVTAAKLKDAGKRAEDIDNIIIDIEVILQTVKQANLLFDAEAWDYLRQINDQVKAQAKRKPELQVIFKQLIDYLARGPRAPKTPPPPPATK